RVVIKNVDGRTLIDIPLSVGVVGTLLAPQLAAIGAIAAQVLRGSIVIEKVDDSVVSGVVVPTGTSLDYSAGPGCFVALGKCWGGVLALSALMLSSVSALAGSTLPRHDSLPAHFDALAAGLPVPAARALEDVDGMPRKSLATRSYLRAGGS